MYTKLFIISLAATLLSACTFTSDTPAPQTDTPTPAVESMPPSVDGAEVTGRSQDIPTGSDAPSMTTGPVDASITGPIAP